MMGGGLTQPPQKVLGVGFKARRESSGLTFFTPPHTVNLVSRTLRPLEMQV